MDEGYERGSLRCGLILGPPHLAASELDLATYLDHYSIRPADALLSDGTEAA